MTTEALAELLAVHLWAVLFTITTVMVLLAWLLWAGLQRYGNRIAALLNERFVRMPPE